MKLLRRTVVAEGRDEERKMSRRRRAQEEGNSKR